MCVVSVILDYVDKRVNVNVWTDKSYKDFQRILQQLEELDEQLDEPDCVDPKKQEILWRIEARLDKLRGTIG